MIKSRLLSFFAKNRTNARPEGRFPQHILFYRDGVSESQYGMVKLEELQRIRDGCVEAFRQQGQNIENIPKITLLVVGKRHHARFYPKSPAVPGQNTPSGLVVDTVVVNPTYADFYLQSHDSPIGTAKSAHYVVIENESGYTLDALEEVVSFIFLP
jgi:eukaryotic translation initiation factor 2C